MGTYAVAARNDGFLYVTAQNKNIIYLFDPADIRAGDTGFAPYLVTLGFEKSPPVDSVCRGSFVCYASCR